MRELLKRFGRVFAPAPVPASDGLSETQKREGLTGGTFLVLRDFEIRRLGDRAVLNGNEGSVLGCYWAGHSYAITMINAAAVTDAVKDGFAIITRPPGSAAL